jgi:hypothetical protein
MNNSQGFGGRGLEVGGRVLGARVNRSFRVSVDAKEESRIRITKVTKHTLRGDTRIPNFLARFDFLLSRIQLREQLLISYSYKLCLAKCTQYAATINRLIANNKFKEYVEGGVLLKSVAFG